jgi:hypothetical protein
MIAWAVVLVSLAVVVMLGVLLARQGAPWGLSEQPGTTRSRQRPNVVERPAGPDAEAMGVDEAGEPSVRPRRED